MKQQFVETICLKNGSFQALDWHQARLNRVFAEVFPDAKPFDLAETLAQNPCALTAENATDRIRCRVLYDRDAVSVSYFPYHIRPVSSLMLVEDNAIDYHLKFADRNQLDTLFARRALCDDVLIVKDGLVTDTSIGNVALYDGKHWFTPAKPLLQGTKRAQLLANGLLQEREIRKIDLYSYKYISVINAMIDLEEVVFETNTHIRG
ncbi:MAG: aminotransferase class IV family protein [Tannerellaceae bacterium]